MYLNDGKIFGSRHSMGAHITYLFKKYIGKNVSMNDIRKIHETHNIQSEGYNKLTNRQKNEIHHKLLHSTNTANNAYNIIS